MEGLYLWLFCVSLQQPPGADQLLGYWCSLSTHPDVGHRSLSCGAFSGAVCNVSISAILPVCTAEAAGPWWIPCPLTNPHTPCKWQAQGQNCHPRHWPCPGAGMLRVPSFMSLWRDSDVKVVQFTPHTFQGYPGYFRKPHWFSMGLP